MPQGGLEALRQRTLLTYWHFSTISSAADGVKGYQKSPPGGDVQGIEIAGYNREDVDKFSG